VTCTESDLPRGGAVPDDRQLGTTAQASTSNKEPSGAQKLIGDFAAKLVELTDNVLFGDAWARAELAPRDRSLITCAALITNGSTEQLRAHLSIAKTNGLTETELTEVIITSPFTPVGREPYRRSWSRRRSSPSEPRRIFYPAASPMTTVQGRMVHEVTKPF
jgi:4-carboxymuconolactone decarboxylase